MKKISRSSELLWLLGIIFVALGVSVCSKADLGVSMIAAPTFIVHEFISMHFDFLSVGVVEYIVQGIVLIILCAVIRRFDVRYLLAFAVAVIYGYTLDLFVFILRDISFDSVWLKWVMLIAGDAVTALGVACFFKTYMPLQVHELFVAELSGRFRLNINRVKLFFDLSLLAISIVLALSLFGDIKDFSFKSFGYSSFHYIGLGTVVTTLINSPLIALMSKLLDKIFEPTPLFKELEKALARK